MIYHIAIAAAILLGVCSARADFTTGMLARWTFNNASSEQAALSDDTGKVVLKKGIHGRDTAFSLNSDGTVTLGGADFLVADAVNSGSEVFGGLAGGGTIYCRIKYLDAPETAFNFGLMNSLKPGGWPQLIFNAISTSKGLAVRAKGPEKLEAGMGSGHLPVKNDDFSDVAIIFNGKAKKVQLYVNGVMAERPSPMTSLDNFQSLMLGRLKEDCTRKIQIDEVRIYATPLSAEWIAEIEPVKNKINDAPAAAGSAVSSGAAADRLIVEDFSDVGTWRTGTSQNITPGKWFGADLILGATPDASRNDGFAGKLQFDFADAKIAGKLELLRFKASQPEVFADGVEFDANARGINSKIVFLLEDSTGKRFATRPVTLAGNEWKHYRSEAGKTAEQFIPPFKLCKINFEASGVSGSNYILIDDIALTGGVSLQRKVSIRPVLSPLPTEPGKPGKISYRFRSASAQAIDGSVNYKLFDLKDKCIMEKTFPVQLAPFGNTVLEVAIPALETGSYYANCEFISGKIVSKYTDWIAVFHPNNSRKNDKPMWFGIQDTSIWNCDAENELHRGWEKMAGFDIERFGMTGARIDTGTATNFPGVRKYLKANQDLGMLSCFSYTMSAPDYVQKKPVAGGVPTKLDEFRKHMNKVFECLKPFDSVHYFEFWNEPDVGFMNGTLEEYLAALKVVNEARNETAPGVKITSGGVTVLHPKEKKNFSADMYIKGKGLYDIACFHAHGSLLNYSERQEMVDNWLKTAGVDLPVCNTETGDRSGYTPDTIKRQAGTLVRKIVYAKSRNTEFYIWFTLQDYWDMDPQADDSFGLVTSDNRPKPSFIAYNELIRQLGGTGRGEYLKNTGTLDIYRFISNDGKREVLALWPRIAGNRQILPLEGQGEIAAVDIFGKAIPAEVKYGHVSIPLEDAVYVSFPAGAFKYGTAVAAQKNAAGGSAGAETTVMLSVRNPFRSEAGVELNGIRRQMKPGETIDIPVTLSIPGDAANGTFTSEQKVRIKSGSEQLELIVPATVNVSYPVVSGGKPSERIVLDTLDKVHEMSFDPNIPRWMGPKDLSCVFMMSRENGNLKLDIRVTDDKHVMNSSPADAWRDDSVQTGFATIDGKFTELTISGKDGKGAVYAHISPDPALRGEWKVPVSVNHAAGVTCYEVLLPLKNLGIPDKPGTFFRFNFLINENDGRGRVRWIEWKSGIGFTKNPDEFGWAILKP